MTDLTKILGGPWSPPAKRIPPPPEHQLIDAIAAAGLMPPEQVFLDGVIHRFASGSKGRPGAGDKPGWYVAFADGIPAGRFGDWRSGIEQAWRADIGREPTIPEEIAHSRRLEEARAARDAELTRSRQTVAEVVASIWSQAPAASADHPYLKRKNIRPNGARITGDGRLIVPLYGADGTLSSLQYIGHDGEKRYHAGGETGGKYWMIGTIDGATGPIYLAEGFATAATIHQASGCPTVAAYSASNLVPVAGALRAKYPALELVIVADHDKSGVGARYAEQAAAKHGARIVIPPMEGDANDYAAAGHDLALLLVPATNGWLIPADEFSAEPAPIRWLVRGWVQRDAMVMVHGPSGGGKTFLVLDIACTLAAGLESWHGLTAHPEPVVYLAGEGHHGMRARLAAWKHRHGVDHLAMWVSASGCDLNQRSGLADALAALRALPVTPRLIIVDTLHRFLDGDENSAQDARGMLDACAVLMREFSCTVILVHHTGVSDETQHRARGSSAWRGALDIEISVTPPRGDGGPMGVVQRKSKDAELAEPLYFELASTPIPVWTDEDGEPVTSATLEPADAPRPGRKMCDVVEDMKKVEAAWFASDAEIVNGSPYVSRAALRAKLLEYGLTDSTVATYLNPSKGRLIDRLVSRELLTPTGHGWQVNDAEWASTMMIRKGEGQKKDSP